MAEVSHSKLSGIMVEVTKKSPPVRKAAARFSRGRKFDMDVAAQLQRLVTDLAAPWDIDKAVLALLAHGGRATGTQLAVVLRRRKTDVLHVCRQLAAAGTLTRVQNKWKRSDL